MQWTKEEKAFKNSSAESFASLSIGLLTISLIDYQRNSSTDGLTIFLIILGSLSLLFCIYLMLPWNLGKKKILNNFKTDITLRVIKLFAWGIALITFATRLIQTYISWLVVAGIAIIFIAIAIWLFGVINMNKNNNNKKKLGNSIKPDNTPKPNNLGILNNDQLIKLYEIVLEEARHQERRSLQLWAAMAVVYGAATALVYYFRQQVIDVIGPLPSWSFASIMGIVYFCICLSNIGIWDEIAFKCRAIANKIEQLILSGNEKGELLDAKLEELHIIGQTKQFLWPSFKVFWGRQRNRLFNLIMLFFFVICWGPITWWVFVS